MKKYLAKFTLFLMSGICLFLFAACGGAESGGTVELCFEEYDDWTRTDPASEPASDDLDGTYSLTGFLLNLYEDGVLVESIDENSGYAYSGSMVIDQTNVSQSVSFDNSAPVIIDATFVNAPIDTWSGVLHVNQGGTLYDVEYDIAGGELTTWSGLECFNASLTALEALEVKTGTFGAPIAPGTF